MPSPHRRPWITIPALVLLAIGGPRRARAAERDGAEVHAPAPGRGGIVVVPVGDPPAGPSPALEELAHQLRAACRERAPEVVAAAELEQRLGLAARTPLSELERTYAAAQAAFQADEVDTALRLLRGVADGLEASPDGGPVHDLWIRVQLRIALAERALGHRARMVEAIARVLALDPDHAVDPDRYAPSFRRDVEEVRRALAAAGRRELAIAAPAPGLPGLVAYVDGKEVGPVPAHVRLPPGRYRVAASGPRAGDPGGTAIRTPVAWVELGDAGGEVALDTAVAAALRVGRAPALAAAAADRGALAVALGRWASAAQVITVELASEGGQPVLAASTYDVAAGAPVREARAPLGSGPPRATTLAALAAYLVAGEAPAPGPGAVGRDATLVLGGAAGPPAPPPPRWLRPAAYGAGVLAVGALAIAGLQARASADAYRRASAMVRGDGALAPGADGARYDAAIGSGDGARRNAYVAAGASAALAVTAALLGYLSGAPATPPAAGVRF